MLWVATYKHSTATEVFQMDTDVIIAIISTATLTDSLIGTMHEGIGICSTQRKQGSNWIMFLTAWGSTSWTEEANATEKEKSTKMSKMLSYNRFHNLSKQLNGQRRKFTNLTSEQLFTCSYAKWGVTHAGFCLPPWFRAYTKRHPQNKTNNNHSTL